VSLTGNLSTMSITEVLEWLSLSRKSGTLVVNGPRFTKKLYLINGELVAISSDNPREMIGRYLVGSGYLGPDELDYLVEMQDHFRIALGELAVKLGQIPRADMDRLLQIQTDESLADLLAWNQGDFSFLEDELPPNELGRVKLDVRHALMEGVRQHDERCRMRDVVPNAHHVPRLVRTPEVSKLSDGERAVIRAMDGVRTIEEIALRGRVTEFTALSLVYRGAREGWLEVGPPPPELEAADPLARFAWKDVADEIRENVERKHLLDALDGVNTLRQKYGDDPAAKDFAFEIEKEVEDLLHSDELGPTALLAPTVDQRQLMKLQIPPTLGFVLSRVDGRYSVEEVLRQLPGNRLANLAHLHELLRRGLLRAQGVHSVLRYDDPGSPPRG